MARWADVPAKLSEWFELGRAEASRLLPMEGLRAVAVILVFFVHYCSLVDPYVQGRTAQLAGGLVVLGKAGVDLFFVLSGFLIYGNLMRKPQPFVTFMGRRVQRLYPVFITLLAVYLVLSFVVPSESKLPSDASEAFLYILANVLLLPGIFSIRPIITVAWSLSYELFFYLTVPVLIAVLRLRSWNTRVRATAFLIAVIALEMLQPRLLQTGMFICGMILAEVLPALRARSQGRILLDVAAFAAVPVCAFVLLQDLPQAWGFGMLFVTCFLWCAAAFSHQGPIARMLVLRPLRWLGNISYSYYLMHGLVLKIFFFVVAHVPALQRFGEAAFWVLLPPAFILTLIGSALLYLAVERPFSILPAERIRKASVPGQYRTPATT